MLMELTVYVVEQWIKSVATGDFHYKEVFGGGVDPVLYPKLREYIGRCCEKGICESLGRRDGWYRPIQDIPQPVNWQGMNTTADFPIVLPFDLRDYVWIDPGTSIVVTGSKDAGKTQFLMKTVVLNMSNGLIKKVVLLTNMEEGINQLKRRFEAMGVPEPAPFTVIQMIDNFHDAIREPNSLYVIDYIDVPETGEFFMIAPALAKVQAKVSLINSVAVVGLQKRVNSDLAFGGEQTLKKATLYLAMNPGKLKIVSAKVPANPKLLPKNMQWSFSYDEAGAEFIDVRRYYGE